MRKFRRIGAPHPALGRAQHEAHRALDGAECRRHGEPGARAAASGLFERALRESGDERGGAVEATRALRVERGAGISVECARPG